MSKTTIPAGGITDGTLTSAKLDQDGAFTFNEDSASVDFRVESNGNANAFIVDASADRVGFGIAAPETEMHIQSTSGECELRLTAASTSDSRLRFGDTDDTDKGYIGYSRDTGIMTFSTNNAGGADMQILAASAVLCNSRLIIDADGNSSYKLNAEFGGNSESGAYMNDKDGANNGTYFNFRRQGTEIGGITRNGTNDAVSYTTSSDYRLKDGIVDKTDGITKLKQLKPRKFYWKSDSDKTLVDGFVAHEVSSIVPEAISGTKDATETLQKVVLSASGDVVRTNIEQADWTHGKTEEGGEIYASNTTWEATKQIIKPQGIDQSKLVPLLTAALKEAITEIESLKARVTTLEG